jgi:hypothetical protein
MTKQDQKEKDMQIRIESLGIASRNKPYDSGSSALIGHKKVAEYNLIAEAKKIEKYIKTGK